MRVHLTSIDHPILGDKTYGGAKVMTVAAVPVPRVMLHARTLGFTHPTGGEYHQFDVPFPADMAQVRDELAVATARSNQ